ncbi:MAG: hypothetical protein O7B79_05135, partial [SAR324 cluster bacterium]|nr:hypothetical protein [SAR324 cluster bacterium]
MIDLQDCVIIFFHRQIYESQRSWSVNTTLQLKPVIWIVVSNRSIVQSSLAKISLMMSTTAPPNKVNPYCDWIYDYPANLIPEPTPELLYKKRTAGPVCSQRVLVELGSGSGNFLLQLGQHWPGCHLVGFELRYKRL